jgi:hypothetical protein
MRKHLEWNLWVDGFVAALFFVGVGMPCFGQGYWWKAPQLKYVEDLEDDAHGTSPHYWTLGGPSTTDATLDQTYLYTCDSGTNANFCQYVVAQLRAANSPDLVTHRWATQHLGLPKGSTQFGNRLVVGNGGVPDTPFTSYPDDYTLGNRVEALLTADVSPDCDTLHFNHDGTFLYTDHYYEATGSRTSLHRFRVTGSLEKDGQAFTLDAAWQDNGTFLSSVARLRNFEVKYIGGKDLIYYGEGNTLVGSSSVYVFDPEAGKETILVPEVFKPGEVQDADIVNVKVAGVAAGNLHLYVMGNIAGLKVYDLSPDGLRVENDGKPVAAFTTEDLNLLTESEAFSSHCRALLVTDDQEYAFFSSHNANNSIFVITAKPGTPVGDWVRR